MNRGALLVGALLALVVACGAEPDASPPPPPSRPVYGPVAGPVAPGMAEPQAPGAAPAPAAVPPAGLTIPGLGVVTGPLIPLGVDAAGAMEVPPDATGTGWYRFGPQPGDTGPAIVAAHVDYDGVPGVFARLGELRPGDPVSVRRADGTEVAFAVYQVDRYPKDAFPTSAVYGNTTGPELRLITCGGSYDPVTGHYRDNVVVYARTI